MESTTYGEWDIDGTRSASTQYGRAILVRVESHRGQILSQAIVLPCHVESAEEARQLAADLLRAAVDW
jgi:hypothetical protein